MPPKTRLLIHSNAPYAPTGYGNQVGLFAPLLNETYDVGISCFYGLEGNSLRWQGRPLLPGLGGEFGKEYILDHAKTFFDDDRQNPRRSRTAAANPRVQRELQSLAARRTGS